HGMRGAADTSSPHSATSGSSSTVEVDRCIRMRSEITSLSICPVLARDSRELGFGAGQVARVSRHRPAQAQPRDIAQNVVALGHEPPFHPRHEVCEGAVPRGCVDTTVPWPAECTLYQQM